MSPFAVSWTALRAQVRTAQFIFEKRVPPRAGRRENEHDSEPESDPCPCGWRAPHNPSTCEYKEAILDAETSDAEFFSECGEGVDASIFFNKHMLED